MYNIYIKSQEVLKMEKLIRFFKDEEGATAAEYALLVALIAVAIIGGAYALGTNINTKLSGVATTITTPGTGS
jgi:pilus assembly protein Flp/PilA